MIAQVIQGDEVQERLAERFQLIQRQFADSRLILRTESRKSFSSEPNGQICSLFLTALQTAFLAALTTAFLTAFLPANPLYACDVRHNFFLLKIDQLPPKFHFQCAVGSSLNIQQFKLQKWQFFRSEKNPRGQISPIQQLHRTLWVDSGPLPLIFQSAVLIGQIDCPAWLFAPDPEKSGVEGQRSEVGRLCFK
jgi:hypothetical protein